MRWTRISRRNLRHAFIANLTSAHWTASAWYQTLYTELQYKSQVVSKKRSIMDLQRIRWSNAIQGTYGLSDMRDMWRVRKYLSLCGGSRGRARCTVNSHKLHTTAKLPTFGSGHCYVIIRCLYLTTMPNLHICTKRLVWWQLWAFLCDMEVARCSRDVQNFSCRTKTVLYRIVHIFLCFVSYFSSVTASPFTPDAASCYL